MKTVNTPYRTVTFYILKINVEGMTLTPQKCNLYKLHAISWLKTVFIRLQLSHQIGIAVTRIIHNFYVVLHNRLLLFICVQVVKKSLVRALLFWQSMDSTVFHSF